MDGKQVASDRLTIDYRIGDHGPLTDITLTALPQADGLIRIEALAFDAKRRRVLDSAERVHFSLDGAGTLLKDYGVADKSAVLEMANGRAAILYRPEPGRVGIVGVLSQDFRGRFIQVGSKPGTAARE